VDILDIVRTVNIVLEVPPEPSEYELWASNVNLDSQTNILDLVVSMNFILFESPLNEEWTFISTDYLPITIMKLYPPFLYVGTYNDGLWRINLNSLNSVWEYLGLSSEETGIEDYVIYDFIRSESVPNTWVVTGVNYDPEIPGVFKTTDGGDNWYPSIEGLEWSNMNYYSDLYQIELVNNQLVGWGSRYFSSENFGDYWEFESLDYNEFLNTGVFEFSFFTKSISNEDILWAGGISFYFENFIIKSIDSGNSWIDIPLYNFFNIFFTDLVLDPFNPEIIYLVDSEGVIYKTSQGGDDWVNGNDPTPIFAHPIENSAYCIEINKNDPNHIFSSGGSYLYQSFDGGNSWEEIISPIYESETIYDLSFDSNRNQLLIFTWYNGILILKEW